MSTNKTRSDWERLNKIFAEAVELSATQQRAYLADACGDDKGLLNEAEAILAASNRAAKQDFLESDAFAAGASVLATEGLEFVPEVEGYTVIREIGRGGMGAVYLAERNEFQQQVAVKVIKRGSDTDDVVRRFHQERDLLAALKHPNIAHLIDGGTTADGRPFFALEHIDGEPITRYCDARRLGIDDRLRLFRKVCSAVAYAHANLVIHRDIKPANILIGTDGEPKLLDFGIAKVLSDSSSADTTETEMRLLTPDYAAPEQVLGQKVTTATDVYSLGVLLYELLCGHRPMTLKDKPAHEVARLVSLFEPSSPSTAAMTGGRSSDPITDESVTPETVADSRGERPDRLRRRLAGDLDNIVLMALRKEPERRYGSVEQFSEDIERHLIGLPVIARPATFGYTAAKFVRRHRTQVAFAAVALAAVIGGSGVAGWQAYRANIERTRAERRFNEIRQLANTLVSGWDKDIPETQITTAVRGRIADISAAYINNLANETNDPELLKELIKANIKVGHDYAYSSFDLEKARTALESAVMLSRRLVNADPTDLDAKVILKDSLANYAEASTMALLPGAIENTRERAELLEQVANGRPDDTDALQNTAYEVAHYAGTLRDFGMYEQAVDLQRKAITMNRTLLDRLQTSPDSRERRRLAMVLRTMAFRSARDLTDPASARDYAVHSAEIADSAVGADPGDLGFLHISMSVHSLLGGIERVLGDLQASDAAFQMALERARAANEIELQSYSVRCEYDSLVDLAANAATRGDRRRAEQMLEDAIEVQLRFTALPVHIDAPTSHLHRVLLYNEAANQFRRIGNERRAGQLYEQAEAARARYTLQVKVRDLDVLEETDLLLAYGDQLAGVGMCTENPPYYLDVGRFDRYCPPQRSSVTAGKRAGDAISKFREAKELLDGLVARGAASEHVKTNLRIANGRLAALSAF